MAQGILPFKVELERSEAGMTALAGLPLYLDLAKVVEISRLIQRHLWERDNGQGWTDGLVVMALIMLNLEESCRRATLGRMRPGGGSWCCL